MTRFRVRGPLSCYNGPPLTEHIQLLVIVWLNECNENLLVPQGIFCSVIVRLIKEEELKFLIPLNGYFIHRNAMSFQIQMENEGYIGTLHFINKYKHIELYFTGHNPAEYCPLIRKIVMKAISESSKRIRVDEGRPVPAFACPETEGCYCLVKNEKNESSHCTFPKSAEVIKGQESYWNWFHAPKHNNSEVCHTHLDKTQLNEVNTSLTNASFRTAEWVLLGDKLGLYHNTLDIIKTNNPNNVEACLREMLVKWLEEADASEATWSSLLKALEDINQKAVARKIRCQLQEKTTIAN